MFFADLKVLNDEYPGAKLWLDEGIPRNSDGLWQRDVFQFGDWLDPLAPADDPGAATTNKSYVADSYLLYVTDLVARMAVVLGSDVDAAKYRDAAITLKDRFNAAWIDDQGMVYNETQTGLVLPLWFDLFTDTKQAASATERLQAIIKDNDYLVGTGFAGTHLLGLTLSKHNLTDVFYKMILQTTVPSWLYQVVSNGTTTWERWDSMLPNGSINPGEMTSFNHYAFGSVGNWMYRTIGGLAPKEAGWKTAEVKPVPGGDLTEARASYLSPYGLIGTQWNIDGAGTFHLTVSVPPNSKAEITLPGRHEKTLTVGSGEWKFTVGGEEL